MKIKTLFVSMAYVAMYAMISSCSNEESVINSGQVTAFAGVMVSETPITRVSLDAPNTPISTFLPATRTSMNRTEIGGKGIFLWEPGDYIFVEDDNDELHKSQNTVTETQPRSTFFMNGSYTKKGSYNVYYKGTITRNLKEVIINYDQTQRQFNNTSHFGESGDCGVAVAKKNTEAGKTGYKFDLVHKASYICFLPYIKEQAKRQSYKIQKIELINTYSRYYYNYIAGTFNLSSTNLEKIDRLSSNTITLQVGENGLTLANQAVDAPNIANSLYMVVAPGTHTIEITYTVLDMSTNQTLSYTKKYGRRTFEPNKVYEIAVDLGLTTLDGGHSETDGTVKMEDGNIEYVYSGHEFYMWDAKENYWSGQEWDSKNPLQPTENLETYNNYPREKEDDSNPNRWYNERAGTFEASTPLFQSLPNANEAAWYIMHGDAHWDSTTQYQIFGKIRTGGIWLKKIDVIAKEQGKTREELKAKTPTGKDFRTTTDGYRQQTIKEGKPAKSVINNYFFLPAIGTYQDGTYALTGNDNSQEGYYWTSTPYGRDAYSSYGVMFDRKTMLIGLWDLRRFFAAIPMPFQ